MMTKLTHSYSALAMYENCPKRYFHQRVEKSVRDSGSPATAYGERVHKALELRLNGEAPDMTDETKQYAALCDALERKAAGGVLTVEEEMTLNAKLEPTGWWDADAWMRSKIDVLIRKGDRAWVLDWKTGKRRVNPAQLELFALQTFLHYPEIDKLTATFIWLKVGKSDSRDYERRYLPGLTASMLSKVQRVERSLAEDEWPARPSGLCGWCPCKDMCEFS